jgi:hypothetical protein
MDWMTASANPSRISRPRRRGEAPDGPLGIWQGRPFISWVDCTHRRSRAVGFRRLAGVIAVIALSLVGQSAPALADGDPASDVLSSQSLFLPQDAGVSAGRQAQLTALLSTAQRHGYELRVAIIASPTDLGSVTALWRHPETYARFLALELALVYKGLVVVLMPNGYGVYPPAAKGSALEGLNVPGRELGTASLAAIERLGAARGLTLVVPTVSAPTGSSSFHAVPWIVFAIGAILVVLSWATSLRARPVRRRSLSA